MSQVKMPTFSRSEFLKLLTRSLSELTEAAAQQVRAHMSRCMDDKGEDWIVKGLSYFKDDICPFCGQPTGITDFIQLYEAFFGQAYLNLRTEIQDFKRKYEQTFSDTILHSITDVINNNATLIEFWSDHISFNVPSIDVTILRARWAALKAACSAHLERKFMSPLELVTLDEEIDSAIANYEILLGDVANYNNDVQLVNEQIEAKKEQVASKEIGEQEHELIHLQNIQRRFEEDVVLLCDDYRRMRGQKSSAETEKENRRSKLTSYCAEIIERYEQRLNQYLAEFMAEFRIVEQRKPNFRGGRASLEYSLEIRGQPIALGTSDTEGVPHFGSALSEGDKCTLALSFFLARLDEMSDAGLLKDTIVVLDDPVSSFDSHRRRKTSEHIKRISEKARQVLVFSHDMYFLKLIYDDTKGNGDPKCLQIIRTGTDDSTLVMWDIEHEARSEYFVNYERLVQYHDEGLVGDKNELRDIARCIRPLLEGYFKMRFPLDVEQNKSFGKGVIKKITNARPPSRLVSAQHLVPELDAINNYSKNYHHDENPAADAEPINDHELKDMIRRTLNIIHG